MSQKNKKHKHKTASPQARSNPVQEARGALAEKRFTHAIEQFKQLLRRENSPEWRRALAEAYEGRARELVSRGLFQEALAVLENLPRICEAALPQTLYLKALLGAQKYSEAIAFYSKLANEGLPPDSEGESVLVATLLTASPALLSGLDAAPELLADGERIRAALQALATGEDERCRELLKQIGFRSAYRDFRYFIAGLLAHYHAQPEEALARLPRIPASSILHELAHALMQVTRNSANGGLADLLINSNEAERRFALALLGRDDVKTDTLQRIGAACARKDFRGLFFALRKYRYWFEDEPLQKFCLAAIAHEAGATKQYEELFETLPPFEAVRLQALEAEHRHKPELAAVHWQVCLARVNEVNFPDTAERNMARALILRKIANLKWMAEQEDLHDDMYWDDDGDDDDWDYFMDDDNDEDEDDEDDYEDDDDDFDDEDEFEDEPESHWIKYLEDSLEHDPEDKETYQRLIVHYQSSSDKTNTRKWLEAMVRQFPDDVDALLLHANNAFERKAFKTGLDALNRLLAIDPIHQQALAAKIHFHVVKARSHIKDRKYHLARKEFAKAAEAGPAKHRNGAVEVKWGLMELLAGNSEEGRALLQEGKQLHGDHLGAWLLVDIEARRIGVAGAEVELERRHFHDALKQPATIANVNHLMQTMTPYLSVDYPDKRATERHVLQYLDLARNCDHDENSLLLVCEYLSRNPFDFKTFQHYAALAKKKFPHQPRFLFYHCLAKSRGMAFHLSPQELQELKKAAESAKRNGDSKTAYEINKFLEPASSFFNPFGPGSPLGGNSFLSSLFESLFGDDDDDEDGDEEWADRHPGSQKTPRPAANKKQDRPDDPSQTSLF